MRVARIQSNQQSFGTKVKINKQLRKSFSQKDGGRALEEYIKALENNGNNDSFFIASGVNRQNNHFMHADVFKMKGVQLYVGKTIEQNLPEEGCPNLAKMYLEAKQNLHPFF